MDLITGARIFHFGTLSLTHEGVRAATKKAVKLAKEAGGRDNITVILIDPDAENE